MRGLTDRMILQPSHLGACSNGESGSKGLVGLSNPFAVSPPQSEGSLQFPSMTVDLARTPILSKSPPPGLTPFVSLNLWDSCSRSVDVAGGFIVDFQSDFGDANGGLTFHLM